MATNNNDNDQNKGEMTTREAGHLGGQRVRELINEGKEAEQKGGSSSSDSFGERAGQPDRDNGDSEDQ